MSDKSAAIVAFIANLLPIYTGERHGTHWCARSLQDGTLVMPFDAGPDGDADDEGWVNIHWQGDEMRRTEVFGQWIVTIAVERYARLHGASASEEDLAAELWFIARHFEFKTGCHLYFPELREPPHPFVRSAKQLGQGILVNLISKPFGA